MCFVSRSCSFTHRNLAHSWLFLRADLQRASRWIPDQRCQSCHDINISRIWTKPSLRNWDRISCSQLEKFQSSNANTELCWWWKTRYAFIHSANISSLAPLTPQLGRRKRDPSANSNYYRARSSETRFEIFCLFSLWIYLSWLAFADTSNNSYIWQTV